MAVINKEQWLAEVQPKLHTSIEFLKHMRNLDAFNEGGIIHIPQAGSSPDATVNRTEFPVPVFETNDSEILMTADNISTDQRRVVELNKWNSSYDIRSYYLDQDVAVLRERIAKYSLDKLFASTPVEYTSGSTSGDYLSNGATGTRKAITYKDITKLKAKFDKDNIPTTGRKLLLDSHLLNQLLEDDKVANMFYNGSQFNTKESAEAKPGVVGKIAGFEVLTRSFVGRHTNAGAFKASTVADAATDCLSGIAFHEDFVGNSLSKIFMFVQNASPAYLSDLYAMQVQVATTKMRSDAKGVVAITQAV